jgi:hypothetical protein
MKNRVRLAAVLSASLIAGCNVFGAGNRIYEAQRLELSGTRTTLVGLVVDYAKTQQWTILSTGDGAGVPVEALTAPVDISGMTMRDRWYFWIQDNEILVEMRLEVRFDADYPTWSSSQVLCDTYAYNTEHQHMQELADRAGKRGGRLLATAGGATIRN